MIDHFHEVCPGGDAVLRAAVAAKQLRNPAFGAVLADFAQYVQELLNCVDNSEKIVVDISDGNKVQYLLTE